MFNNKYGLTKAVKEGIKTMTRRVLLLSEADEEYLDQAFDWDLRESVILDRYAEYKVGDIVAVAQSYLEVYEELLADEEWDKHRDKWNPFRHFIYNGQDHTEDAGWRNKMFVKPDLMPSNIRITYRKIERLHSISVEDCLKEGVMIDPYTGLYFVPNLYLKRRTKNTAGPTLFGNPEFAYYNLCKKLRMILDTAANPWMVAYNFEYVEKGGHNEI